MFPNKEPNIPRFQLSKKEDVIWQLTEDLCYKEKEKRGIIKIKKKNVLTY